ncbi:MAG: hypothetical protein VST71_06655 [Nitrospirota bacterium]|nr:hypothetical protein [Nitrospirota bacterium]
MCKRHKSARFIARARGLIGPANPGARLYELVNTNPALVLEKISELDYSDRSSPEIKRITRKALAQLTPSPV